MSEPLTASRLANTIAGAIREAFDDFREEFRRITRRAHDRFVRGDWQGMVADSRARLDVYEHAVQKVVQQVRQLPENQLYSKIVWASAKAVYSGFIAHRLDWDIAETFYNSVTRRVFDTIGVDQEIEFVHTDFRSPPTRPATPIYVSFPVDRPWPELIRGIIGQYGLPLSESELDREAQLAAADLEPRLKALLPWDTVESIEMLRAGFYRGEHVHLVGRLSADGQYLPMVFSFRRTDLGVILAAILLEQDDVSLLFSYTRSYFHVEVDCPYEMVRFLKTILPRKPTAELYIAIGYNKHGKTELYRHALRHLAGSTDKYQLARGQRGMVMTVFTMPSYPVVFKIIKDRFDYPKETTRQAVMDCYRMIFKHDRAGRLIDAQEYRYMTLDRQRFDEALLTELLEVASRSVQVQGDQVVIKHCYAERRVTPLDLYLHEASPAAARRAVIDYGQAIKDLAITNIFPGDLLLKNFGVTRQGRVVFYDYDEVCRLTDCIFREMPKTDDYDDDLAAEPWYGVGRLDVFPEEFQYFLALSPELRGVLLEHHGELFTVDYWREIQRQLAGGKWFHILPYPQDKQLRRSPLSQTPPASLLPASPACSTSAPSSSIALDRTTVSGPTPQVTS